MRLFFALVPPAELAAEIASWRLRYLSADGREVPVANLHITLAFLGEISPHRLEQLCCNTDELLAKEDPRLQALTLDETGYWPKPGILWLGPSRWPDSLTRLAGQLQTRGAAAGGRGKAGAYRPHITLFRGCERPPPAALARPDLCFPCADLALLESRNGRRGVQYRDVANWQLGP